MYRYKSFVVIGILLFTTLNDSFAQTLLKDIRTQIASEYGKVDNPIVFGDKIFFLKSDKTHGQELWVYDGVNTSLFLDLHPGTPNSGINDFVIFNDELYFTSSVSSLPDADNNVTASESRSLWKTDGTEGNVSLVAAQVDPMEMTPGETVMYFAGRDGTNGRELWKTDGTPEGTALVINIVDSNGNSDPGNLITIGDNCFFAAYFALPPTPGLRREVYYTDGTESGTIQLDIPNPSPGQGSQPTNLTLFNGKVYFLAIGSAATETEDRRKAVWETDGTLVGTTRVKLLEGTTQLSTGALKLYATDTHLFYTDVLFTETKVYAYNGTGVTDVFAVDQNLSNLRQANLQGVYGSNLYFKATDTDGIFKEWVSDGTSSSTTNFYPPVFSDLFFDGTNFFYNKNDKTLYSSDEAGNESEVAVFTNDFSWQPQNFLSFSGSTYFIGADNVDGKQLWKTDGTSVGTLKVSENELKLTLSSNPTNFRNINGTVYFNTSLGLYQTDGTSEGTVPFTDINFDVIKEYNPQVVFKDGLPHYVQGNALYQITTTDTVQIYSNTDFTLSDLVVLDNKLFWIEKANGGGQFGTILDDVKMLDGIVVEAVNLNTKYEGNGFIRANYLDDLFVFNEEVYFISQSQASAASRSIWKSQGVVESNGDVDAIESFGSPIFGESSFAEFANRLIVYDGDNFYQTDGTSSLQRINFPNTDLTNASIITEYADKLWISNASGTTGGPINLFSIDQDVNVVGYDFAGANLSKINDQLAVTKASSGDFHVFNEGVGIGRITVENGINTLLDGTNFFVDGNSNLWYTDGTQGGTRQISTEGFNAGTNSAAALDDQLIFAGTSSDDSEPYVFDFSDLLSYQASPSTDLQIALGSEPGSLDISWTNGTGDGRMIVASTDENVRLPKDLQTIETYTAGVYGDALLAENTFILDTEASGTITASGFDAETYYFRIVEYQEGTEGRKYDRFNAARATFTIEPYSQVITFDVPDSVEWSTRVPLVAESEQGTEISFGFQLLDGQSASNVGRIESDTLITLSPSTIVVSAIAQSNELYGETTLNDTLIVTKRTQLYNGVEADTITFDEPLSYVLETSLNSGYGITPEVIGGPAEVSSSNVYTIIGTGNIQFLLSHPGDPSWKSFSDTLNLLVEKGLPELAGWAGLPETRFSDTLSLDNYFSVSSSVDRSYLVLDGPGEIIGSDLAVTGVGEISVGGYSVENDLYLSSTDTIVTSITANKANASVLITDETLATSYPLDRDSLDLSSFYVGEFGGELAYTIISGPGFFDDTMPSVYRMSDAGIVNFEVSVVSTENYTGLSRTGSIQINPGEQTIEFFGLNDTGSATATYDPNGIALNASTNSGLPLSYSVVSGDATVTDDTLHVGTSGEIVLSLTQPGNQNWNAAPEEVVTVTILKADQTVAVEAVADLLRSSDPVDLVIDVSSGLSPTVVSENGKVVVNGTQVSVNISASSGLETLTVSQPGDGNYNSASTQIAFCIVPDKPEISLSVEGGQDRLTTQNTVDAHEWFLDGSSVGVVSAGDALESPAEGSYTVITINIDDCSNSELSEVFDYAALGVSIGPLAVYPNPVVDYVIFDSAYKNAQVEIIDLSGQILLNEKLTGDKLDIEQLKAGVYLIRLTVGDELLTSRIIKK